MLPILHKKADELNSYSQMKFKSSKFTLEETSKLHNLNESKRTQIECFGGVLLFYLFGFFFKDVGFADGLLVERRVSQCYSVSGPWLVPTGPLGTLTLLGHLHKTETSRKQFPICLMLNVDWNWNWSRKKLLFISLL